MSAQSPTAADALSLCLALGQAHALPMARALLSHVPEALTFVVGDHGFISHALRKHRGPSPPACHSAAAQ